MRRLDNDKLIITQCLNQPEVAALHVEFTEDSEIEDVLFCDIFRAIKLCFEEIGNVNVEVIFKHLTEDSRKECVKLIIECMI